MDYEQSHSPTNTVLGQKDYYPNSLVGNSYQYHSKVSGGKKQSKRKFKRTYCHGSSCVRCNYRKKSTRSDCGTRKKFHRTYCGRKDCVRCTYRKLCKSKGGKTMKKMNKSKKNKK